MMPTMAKKRTEEDGDTKDVFARLEAETVDKLDAIADDQDRSRSWFIAKLIREFVATEYPKLEARKKGK